MIWPLYIPQISHIISPPVKIFIQETKTQIAAVLMFIGDLNQGQVWPIPLARDARIDIRGAYDADLRQTLQRKGSDGQNLWCHPAGRLHVGVGQTSSMCEMDTVRMGGNLNSSHRTADKMQHHGYTDVFG